MAITASQVMELRKATGLGMMDCKKALNEANGDMELAIDNLRKKGQATAAKRADREAKEGKIAVLTEGNSNLIIEVNSETDFVSRNDDFLEFVDNTCKLLISEKPADMDAAQALTSDLFGGLSLADKTLELVGKIGEKIGLRRFALVSTDDSEKVFNYIHGNGQIGVLVTIKSDSVDALNSAAAEELGKDVAMQIAAQKPAAVTRDEVDADLVAKEREIFLEQVKNSGKPEQIWEKIVDGKMNKFYKQSVLLEQDFIKDPDLTVTKRSEAASKDAGADLTVTAFIRYELGSED